MPDETVDRERVAAGVSVGLLTLADRLRADGVHCEVQRLLTAHRALAAVEPDRHRARGALRASLCASRHDVEAFERAFDELFGDQPIAPIDPGKGEPEAAGANLTGVLGAGDEEAPEEDDAYRVSEWSAIEVLREKPFRAYTVGDRELARTELRRLAATLPQRPSARRRRALARASQLDLRRTMHAAVRHGGDPAELHWRRRRPHPRRLIFVCDVSGSMAPFAAFGLEYVHAVLRAGAQAEAFCFGTRLTRVTAELRAADAATALAAAEAAAVD
ncbi:MAG: VWA domain-containing protein, partial [Solirubrobacterales bacterium]